MTKEDVLAKLEEYKGRPVVIGLSDEGAALYSGIEGHWLFTKGDNLVEVRKNTPGSAYGFGSITQTENPFAIITVPFEIVNYVKSYINNESGDVAARIAGLTPVSTDKTLADIQKEIESDSIHKALSPRGNLNVEDVAPGGNYGAFRGSAISTSSDGLPKYLKDSLV